MSTMDVKETTEDENGYSTRNSPFFETARKVLLASVGAMALAQEEIEDFVHRLIERGEIAETDGRKLMEEIRDRRKTNLGKAEDMVTRRLEYMLKRLSIPTKADVETLNDRISSLSKKLDEMIDRQSE